MSVADKLATIAENVPKVYEAGKKAEYDAFWDMYQQNGERTSYECAFAGKGWNEHTLKPKYDVVPTSAYGFLWHLKSDANIDLVKIEEECGITFDFSNCTSFTYAFYSSGLTRIGIVDTRSCSAFGQFAAASTTLHTIEKLILKDDGSQTISNATWFLPPYLENITIEGKLGASVSLESNTRINKESIISCFSALSDTSTGKTFTLRTSRVATEFETSEGANDGVSSAEWQTLIATKPNWTISLV